MQKDKRRIWNTAIKGRFILNNRKPEVIVFAGPNGSGKSTITSLVNLKCEYINADNIKRSLLCSDIEATQIAYNLRIDLIEAKKDFSFETVLSSDYNLELLKRAKQEGYFIRCFYILTCNPDINVSRVEARVCNGGHDVPKNKIIERYSRCLERIPELVELCDIIHIYDNTEIPFRIFKKRKSEMFIWSNSFWNDEEIKRLVGLLK